VFKKLDPFAYNCIIIVLLVGGGGGGGDERQSNHRVHTASRRDAERCIGMPNNTNGSCQREVRWQWYNPCFLDRENIETIRKPNGDAMTLWF
jgi:hypothetical protein